MATEQFMYLLEQVHKTAQTVPIPWQSTANKREFKIGLGEGSVRLKLFGGNDYSDLRTVKAYLCNGEGRAIDEYEAGEFESENFKWLLELYLQAHATAFKLNRVVDSMLGDLEVGRFRELPQEKEADEYDIPF
ncbi:MAG TPA: hypothetical protein VFZ34_18995 [Blastocatellia bacterium]|nr:hypothetical protein [Blastocatellia bacterium]